MAIVSARRAEAGDSFDRKQVVKLGKGLYSGMLSRYTLPKMVRKFGSEDEEEKMFLSFVVTHDRTNQQLPHFSEAFTGVRPTLFYDPVTQSKSNYVAIVHALIGGKVPCEQIAPSDPYAAPYEFDWDKLVGRPAILFLEPSTKPDKNGLFINKLKSIEPPDAGVIAAVKGLHQARKVETTEKGLAYLTYPATAYQDDADAASPGSTTAADSAGDDLEDEIPF
jgi:hypothetical protein